MTPLCLIAQRHGTDKLRHGYTPLYHTLFQSLRHSPITIAELGILNGASVRTWLEYFPLANVIAVDNLPTRLRRLAGIPRVTTLLANAGTTQLEQLPTEINIVIDDASHKPEDQIAAFNCIWHRIQTGGYYVVEDLHAGWAFSNGRHGFIDYVCQMLTDCVQHNGALKPYADVRFFRNLVVIAKH